MASHKFCGYASTNGARRDCHATRSRSTPQHSVGPGSSRRPFVGNRLDRCAARQHPDLSASSPDTDHRPTVRALRGALFALLALDGVLCAVLAAMLLPFRIGTVLAPISALAAGLVNMLLVWVGLQWTSSPRLAATPLWAWLLTVAALTLGGPGGDAVFGGSGFGEYLLLVLLAGGAAPPAILLWRRRYQQLTSGN